MNLTGRMSLIAVLLCTAAIAAEPRKEIVVANFEGKDYGEWKATGEAFGPGPARGTLPGQMEVSGFEGKGLVNSYFKGDGSVGTLTSQPFKIERKYMTFLIGGGMHPGKACVNLLVDGKIVRTATGPNDRPGGTERLEWQSWDVGDLEGQTAVVEIVDQQTGGWGHINIDHIAMSDKKRVTEPMIREITVERRFLHLPVKHGASKRLLRLALAGQTVREFEIELADGEPDFWAYTDLSEFKGKRLTLETRLIDGSKALDAISQGDEIKGGEGSYREKHRPQFHFTPHRGWTNDPNGLVYYKGEYHLFFQHNPFGTAWGNMTWGHAVSPNLVHWKELGDALHPDPQGTMFSGSAVVDEKNTAGWQTGEEKTLVCIYTAAGGTSAWSKGQPFTQAVAYSNDRGRTWTKYAGNPVLKHVVGGNRDPKVFWHNPTRQWIMALFLDGEQYALFNSPNLKEWARLVDIPPLGCGECPDFFELPVDGDAKNTRWLFWGGSGNYLLGRFDGKAFTKETGPHVSRYGRNDYAAQTYSDIPSADGRRIQLSWMSGGKYPGMPFNQQMTVPRVLTLRTTPEGIRLFIEPVKELEVLRGKEHAWKDTVLKPGQNLLEGMQGELWDIEAEIEPGQAKQVGLNIRGHKVEYSSAEKKLTALGASAPLDLVGGRIRLRILVDRTSIEVFANDGRVCMASCFLPDGEKQGIETCAVGEGARATALKVWGLKSAWQP